MLLLDASVWVAAIDPDDRYHATARPLVLATNLPLGALDLTLYEIANVVGAIKGRRALAERLCRAVLTRSEDHFVRIDATIADHAIGLATEHALTVYDAAYVAAAHKHGWTLVSADLKDLVNRGLAVAPDDSLIQVT